MPKFNVDCYWEMYGQFEVETESLEDAIQVVESGVPPYDGTPEGNVVDGSFTVDHEVTRLTNQRIDPVVDDTYKHFKLFGYKTTVPHELQGHWCACVNIDPDDEHAVRYLMKDLSLGPVGNGTGYPSPGHAWFPDKDSCMKAIDKFWNMEKPDETKTTDS